MRIGVVGAGIAGLQTARLLQRLGHEVTVFEARDRVGGRLWTKSSDPGFFEAGGEWIDADHHRILRLLQDFGQEPTHSSLYPGWLVMNGDVRPENDPSPAATADAEHVHEAAVDMCQRMPAEPWLDPQWAAMDQQTLGDWLDLQCTSPEGRRYVEAVQRSDEGEDTHRVSLLGWLINYRSYIQREGGEMSLYRFPKGAGALCESIAAELSIPVQAGRVLRSVEAKEEGIALWFEGEVDLFDRVVIALPPKPALRIEWPEDFPEEKLQAWEAIGMARTIKVCLTFKSRFWEGTWPGRLLCDLPCQQVWDGGRDQAAILNCYIAGDRAASIVSSSDPVQTVVRALSEILPGVKDQFVKGELIDWLGDPFSGGAFPSLRPGSTLAAWPHLRTSWDRIHFAGDHTADWFGFIEGALESAERVTQEIHHATHLA